MESEETPPDTVSPGFWDDAEIPDASGPYQCPACGFYYIRPYDLWTHANAKHADQPALLRLMHRPRSYKEGKPYCCSVRECPCGYTRRHDLQRHMLTKHGMVLLVPARHGRRGVKRM